MTKDLLYLSAAWMQYFLEYTIFSSLLFWAALVKTQTLILEFIEILEQIMRILKKMWKNLSQILKKI